MYRNIHSRFWSDPKIKSLTPNQRYLFLYLVTNQHTHVSGIYHLPQVFMVAETGLTKPIVSDSLKRFDELKIVQYDQATETVWIRKMLTYQGAGKSIREAIDKHLKTLHPTKLIIDFCDTYHHPVPEGLIDRLNGLTDTVPVCMIPNEEAKKSGRILVSAFNEKMKPDQYCIEYAKQHGLNGQIDDLWRRMIDWHLTRGKSTKDLHATWRTWVDRAPDFNKDLFSNVPFASADCPECGGCVRVDKTTKERIKCKTCGKQ